MTSEVTIIITLSVIIFLSPYLSKIFHIPTTPIEIVLGSIAGYFSLLDHNHLFELIAEVGFYYLMFLAGTEVNLRTLLKLNRGMLRRSLFYIGFLYLFSFILVKLVKVPNIFIVILPLISVGLIMTLYKEYDKESRWLNLAMTIGVLGELVSIVALTVTGAALEHGVGMELYKTLGLLLLFLAIMGLVFRLFRVLFWWFPELKVYLIPIYADKDEKDIRLSMALFFLMIAVMLVLDLEIAFGAFLAGMFIATFFEHHKDLPHKLSSFGFGFLVPIFFVYIGSTFELGSLKHLSLVGNALIITLVMILIRVVSAFSFYRYLNAKEMVLFGLSHAMPLTLLIAIATLAHQNHNIEQKIYYAFILASLFEAIIVMISIKLIHRYWHTDLTKCQRFL